MKFVLRRLPSDKSLSASSWEKGKLAMTCAASLPLNTETSEPLHCYVLHPQRSPRKFGTGGDLRQS